MAMSTNFDIQEEARKALAKSDSQLLDPQRNNNPMFTPYTIVQIDTRQYARELELIDSGTILTAEHPNIDIMLEPEDNGEKYWKQWNKSFQIAKCDVQPPARPEGIPPILVETTSKQESIRVIGVSIEDLAKAENIMYIRELIRLTNLYYIKEIDNINKQIQKEKRIEKEQKQKRKEKVELAITIGQQFRELAEADKYKRKNA